MRVWKMAQFEAQQQMAGHG